MVRRCEVLACTGDATTSDFRLALEMSQSLVSKLSRSRPARLRRSRPRSTTATAVNSRLRW